MKFLTKRDTKSEIRFVMESTSEVFTKKYTESMRKLNLSRVLAYKPVFS